MPTMMTARTARAVAPVAGYTLALLMTGCTTAPVLQKQSFDFKTTALFQKPCPAPQLRESPPTTEALHPPAPAPTTEARAAEPVALVVQEPKPGKLAKLETTDNRCNTTYLEKMVENFLSIREADESRGVPGDTIEEVRRKGFSIVIGGDVRVQRPNTRALYGADALAAVGMGVSAPPLQKVEEIKAYTEFMGAHYGEEYFEKDMKQVVDRFCLNRRESHDIGDDRTFTIVWRNGRVLKRVIKGGPIDNPKQERGLLICPGDFIIETVKGTANSAMKVIAPF
jgi:hypothetical protein